MQIGAVIMLINTIHIASMHCKINPPGIHHMHNIILKYINAYNAHNIGSIPAHMKNNISSIGNMHSIGHTQDRQICANINGHRHHADIIPPHI